MKTKSFFFPFSALRQLIWLSLVSTLLPLAARAEAGFVRPLTKAPSIALPLNFPAPTNVPRPPRLLVIKLLGYGGVLLPGGKLKVWVGRDDGVALANASVTFSVPADGNPLVGAGERVTTVTVQTDANGLAEVLLARPKSEDTGGGDGGGGDGGGGEE